MTAPPPLPSSLTRWLLSRRRSSQRGFTLTELIVSMVIGTLIMGSLLYLVVELMGANAREERMTRVQQDTRRALDYMSRDVREAIFVYADPRDVTPQLTDAPTESTPVLAFWRLESIEDDIDDLKANCLDYETDAKDELCDILKVRQSVYELVVYFVRPNKPNDLWAGPNRLIRYRLTAFSDLKTLTYRTGYTDPSIPNPSNPGSNFEDWARTGSTTNGNAVVLTDAIDRNIADSNDAMANAGCPTNPPGYTKFPPDSNNIKVNNVFTCMNTTATGAEDNKTIVLFLRGSIADNTGDNGLIFGPSSTGSRLPTLSTEVQIRGVLERERS